MSRFRTALALLREIHPADLLLPIGSALVISGLQNLTERERRQRERLAALQGAVNDHLDALLGAGVAVPAGLDVDERHPLDSGGLAGPGPDYRITGNGNSETSSNSYPDGSDYSSTRRRRWKLAVLALAGVAGVITYARVRDSQIAEHAAQFAAAAFRGEVDPETLQRDEPSPWDRAEPVYPPHSHDYTAAAESTCTVCGAPGVAFAGLQEVKHDLTPCEYCGHPHDPQTSPHPAGPAPEPSEGLPSPAEEVAALAELVDGPDPLGDECGWTGCTWVPKETTRGAARVTALAVHRAKCVHRPPSMTVPGA